MGRGTVNRRTANRRPSCIIAGMRKLLVLLVFVAIAAGLVFFLAGRAAGPALTVTGPTRVSEVRHGQIIEYELTPEEVGLSTYPLEAIKGGDAEENAEITRRVLAGETGAPRDIVLLNTAAVLYIADRVDHLSAGVQIARETIDSGRAQAKLDELIAYKQRVGESHVS